MNVYLLFVLAVALLTNEVCAYRSTALRHHHGLGTFRHTILYGKKITPNRGESMDQYRKAVLDVLKAESPQQGKLGGRELLEMIVKKWGVAYDLQLRKTKPFGDGSENIYVNVMWRYFGQKSFPMNEREYLEHLEAIGRYISAMNIVDDFKDKIKESRKRPNAYFGYAVPIPLNVDPASADKFFKDLPYE